MTTPTNPEELVEKLNASRESLESLRDERNFPPHLLATVDVILEVVESARAAIDATRMQVSAVERVRALIASLEELTEDELVILRSTEPAQKLRQMLDGSALDATPLVEMRFEKTELHKKVGRLQALLVRYGDRVRMARAEPAEMQWEIDEAMSRSLTGDRG